MQPPPPSAEGGEKMQQQKQIQQNEPKVFQSLSTHPQEFQVRVHIIEGRQLQGRNLNTVVTVNIGIKTKKTAIQIGNSPTFDEMFYFTYFGVPENMFKDIIHFKVLNAKKESDESEIGSFKIDIGVVYNESDHVYPRKWLLMTELKENKMMARGFLKVTIMVLLSGEKEPGIVRLFVRSCTSGEDSKQPPTCSGQATPKKKKLLQQHLHFSKTNESHPVKFG
uniref:myoferlin-like n=1 Tax=Myxine glutinosa TaxID=7769 RepID=UPI00358EB83B